MKKKYFDEANSKKACQNINFLSLNNRTRIPSKYFFCRHILENERTNISIRYEQVILQNWTKYNN